MQEADILYTPNHPNQYETSGEIITRKKLSVSSVVTNRYMLEECIEMLQLYPVSVECIDILQAKSRYITLDR